MLNNVNQYKTGGNMKDILKSRLGGLKSGVEEFWSKLGEIEIGNTNFEHFPKYISKEMKNNGYDVVSIDKAENVVGLIKGSRDEGDIVILSHFDATEKTGGNAGFKNGITSGLFAGTLLENSLAPLKGNIIFCCIPNINNSEARVEYLFSETLKHRRNKIKSVLLCESTGLNVYLGHKGRMEYEIQITGDFSGQTADSKMQMAFPLVNELYKVGEKLPLNSNLGKSKLSVRDVSYTKNDSSTKEMKFTVDRVFVPEEFFFQAEDGIRDWSVTGVQTCAIPIRSEEHTSGLQSLTNLVCRLLLRLEEHTSELQSLTNLVCRLLLEKKKPKRQVVSQKGSEEHQGNQRDDPHVT